MSAPNLVLVVEDDVAAAEFLQLALRAMGHEVAIAVDGQQALAMAAAQPPQLVLLDALLPKLDGFGVLRELRKSLPQVPIVMMSGIYQKRSYVQDALDLGARDYLNKPLSVLKVWELAERYLGEVAQSRGEPAGFAGTPLSERPLACALAEAAAERATGMLFVRGPEGTAILFLEDGRVIFGRSSDRQTRLDKVLESQGTLSQTAKKRMRELLDKAKGRARLGDLLVENGLLSEENLKAALSQQQRMHVTRPLTWTEGRSQFFASETPRHESFKLELDMEALVLWAARHLPPGPALEAWLPASDRSVKAVRDLRGEAARLQLSAPELDLLELADGSRTIGALRAMGRLAQVDVDRLLASLCSLGLLQAGQARGEQARRLGAAGANGPAAGAVKNHPPARVLLATGLAGKTGALRYENGQAQRTVWFQDGRIAFANSNDAQDRLGQVLLRAGFVSNEQLRAALAASKEQPGVALGRILVDQKTLTLDDLHGALVAQVREVVASLVCWREGTFNFTSGPLPTQEIVPLALDPLELVLAALRATPFTALAKVLPGTSAHLRKTWQCFELAAEMELTQLEDRLLGALDSHSMVGGLLDSLGENPEASLRAVHLLMSLGLVEESEAAPARSPKREAVAHADGFADEDFDDEAFGEAEAVSAGASDGAEDGFADEGFDDESFGDFDNEPQEAAPSFDAPISGGEDSFAGLADEPALSGLIQAGSELDPQAGFGGQVTGGEDSFAGLADDEPALSGLIEAGSALDPQPAGAIALGTGDTVPPGAGDFDELAALVGGGDPAPAQGADLFAGELRGETGFTGAVEGPADEPDLGLGEGIEALGDPGVQLGDELAAAFADLAESEAQAKKETAVATMEAPLPVELQTFLALLADHLRAQPGAVPEHVLALLPPELRERFGM